MVLVPLAFAALIVLHAATGWAAQGRLALLACRYLLWAAAITWCARVIVDALGLTRAAVVLAWSVLAGALASAIAAIVQVRG